MKALSRQSSLVKIKEVSKQTFQSLKNNSQKLQKSYSQVLCLDEKSENLQNSRLSSNVELNDSFCKTENHLEIVLSLN